MKKKILLLMGVFAFGLLKAQIGIVTNDPKATLDVRIFTSGNNTSEGIIYPKLTRAELIAKMNANLYGADQTGATLYITRLNEADVLTTATEQITQLGFYCFDGAIWQPSGYKGEAFYLHSFNMPYTVGPNSYNIYNVYANQYRASGNASWLSSNNALVNIPNYYVAAELDFVISFYDNQAITVNSITAAGVLSYTVSGTIPINRNNSMLTIVLRPKR